MSARNSFDDCDWNMHMSNSSYAKILDYARIAFLSKRLIKSHFDGIHFALGGSTYIFHAEIPLLAKYEVETFFGAWDEKWICEHKQKGEV
jgi:acyl-CoA thioesterase FadM